MTYCSFSRYFSVIANLSLSVGDHLEFYRIAIIFYNFIDVALILILILERLYHESKFY